MKRQLYGLTAALIMLMFLFSISSSASEPKTVVQDKIYKNTIGMVFARIPSGTFQAGSPPDEPGREPDERQHTVSIAKPFYLQTTEVTQGQWEKIMGYNPSQFKDCGADCPLEMISRNEAWEFVKKLNQAEKTEKYHLPTSAEWEYACRAGTVTPFSTGSCITTEMANFSGKSVLPACPRGKNRKRTVRVGSFAANPWGLYDMHGNVWEWCQDWYGRKHPAGREIDPQNPSFGAVSILRGGSWYSNARFLRSAYRRWEIPDYRSSAIGFRVARDM